MKRAIAFDNVLYLMDDSSFTALFSNPIDGSMVHDPGREHEWSEFGFGSIQPAAKETLPILSESSRSENFKKRKLESVKGVGALRDEDDKEKKIIRGSEKEEDEEEKSKITEENIGSTKSITKKKKVITKELQHSSNGSSKSDYIHVRARRGQATDSHSLAERVRREKISERMKFLQDLVPGCNKITGKVGMLDEIINYVQSLQCQIEFLPTKLSVVNPRFNVESVDDIFGKEVNPEQTANVTNVSVQSSGIETTINTPSSDPMWDTEM